MTSEKGRIRELERELAQRDRTILKLQNSINDLTRQIENLTEIILQMRRDKFGPSSEKTRKADDGGEQLSLFNEAELEANSVVSEPFQRNAKGQITPRRKRVRRDIILADLPVEEILLQIPEEELVCEQCRGRLTVIGREYVREELQYIPSQLKRIVYVRESYECPKCKHTEKPFLIRTTAPPSLLNHSLASPGSVAYVMYQKYVQGIPLYRQEKDWERMGILLSRATMANWVIRCAQDYLMPIIDFLRRQLLSRDILHVDETPVQVLKEEGRKPQSKSYMWLYRTGKDGKAPIILFDYQPSGSGEHAAAYLKDFKGYVHSDGYSGYNKLMDYLDEEQIPAGFGTGAKTFDNGNEENYSDTPFYEGLYEETIKSLKRANDNPLYEIWSHGYAHAENRIAEEQFEQQLSKREIDVLTLLSNKLTICEIMQKLDISEEKVKFLAKTIAMKRKRFFSQDL